MIELRTLVYTKAELAGVPEKERTFFLLLTSFANDIQSLSKLVRVVLGRLDDGLIESQGRSSVGMLAIRLLAGRLWEGWKLLEDNRPLLITPYQEYLGHEPNEALQTLQTYFADRKNLIRMIRDKIGFHADAKIAKQAFDRFPDDAELGDYMCQTIGNTLYYTTELIQLETINGFVGKGDQPGSLRQLVSDTSSLTSAFQTFTFGFVGVFVKRHLRENLERMNEDNEILENVPKFEDLEFCYFSELPVS